MPSMSFGVPRYFRAFAFESAKHCRSTTFPDRVDYLVGIGGVKVWVTGLSRRFSVGPRRQSRSGGTSSHLRQGHPPWPAPRRWPRLAQRRGWPSGQCSSNPINNDRAVPGQSCGSGSDARREREGYFRESPPFRVAEHGGRGAPRTDFQRLGSMEGERRPDAGRSETPGGGSMSIHKELAFEEPICVHLGSHGWIPDGDRHLRSAFSGNVPQR